MPPEASGRCLTGIWAPPGNSHQAACPGPWGAGAGLAAGRPALGRTKEERRARAWLPSSHPPESQGVAESQAWGCQMEVGETPLCHPMLDGSNGIGGHRSGARVWEFPLFFLSSLHPFSTACCLPVPDCPIRPRSPSSGKSPSPNAAVGGCLCTGRGCQALEGNCVSFCTSLPFPSLLLSSPCQLERQPCRQDQIFIFIATSGPLISLSEGLGTGLDAPSTLWPWWAGVWVWLLKLCQLCPVCAQVSYLEDAQPTSQIYPGANGTKDMKLLCELPPPSHVFCLRNWSFWGQR